jgi:hypothetical protein
MLGFSTDFCYDHGRMSGDLAALPVCLGPACLGNDTPKVTPKVASTPFPP